MLVFAHPDDETVGMGASLPRLGSAWFVCVTDGAPSDGSDAARAGCRTHGAYACLRQEELRTALRAAGHAPDRISFLGIADQAASLRLAEIARVLDTLVGAIRPHLVVTHPYEGGHPDHDATAFAVHAAIALRAARGVAAPMVLEMTSYHRHGDRMAFGEFLGGTGTGGVTLTLDAEARAQKRSLIACHASQARVLAAVPLDCERFRRAPQYDFARPPHEGVLLYELFPWGMTGPHWRVLAQAAVQELGLAATRFAANPQPACA